MKRRNNKKGIALIALSIILLILVLLSGIITYIGYDIMTTAKNTAYAKDLSTVTDAVMEYYAVNGSMPVLEGGKKVNVERYKEDIVNSLGEEALGALTSEIAKNNDHDAMFYEIDISKIGIDDLKYGVKENEYDLFVISNNSHVVYYYSGYENNSGIYFSNSDLIEK